MEIQFLSVEDVIFGQERQLEIYGGGLPGILNRGSLESAVAMPQAGFGGEYAHKDLFEMASAYLFHLVSGHAFGNGNKRIGLDSALVFLHLNGVRVEATNEAIADLVLGVAESRTGKDEVAAFLRQHGVTIGGDCLVGAEAFASAREWMHRTYAWAFAKLAE